VTPLRQGYGAQGRVDCPQETTVVNAVLSGSWPDRCDEALVAHAAGCDTCREIAAVSVLLREDVDHARIEVHVPAAGQVWWRAAVRARLESTHAATRPMTWMHGITAAIVLGLVLAALTAAWPLVPQLLASVRTVAGAYAPSAEVATAIAGGLRLSVILGVFAAAFMIIAPLAVYFVLSDD
jgi:hypothetical protein